MKLTLIAVASTVVALPLFAQAEDMPGMKMDAMPMEGMQRIQEIKQAPVVKAEGTIKAIDTTKHTVTIAHGAVPAVQWPAMSMAFNATSQQLAGLKAVDQVAFEFRAQGIAGLSGQPEVSVLK